MTKRIALALASILALVLGYVAPTLAAGCCSDSACCEKQADCCRK